MAVQRRRIPSRASSRQKVRPEALAAQGRCDGNVGDVRLVRREHEAAVARHFSVHLEHEVVSGHRPGPAR